MKPTILMQKVGEPAGATTARPRRGVVRWASAGFGLGGVSGTAYLLLGGEYFIFIPCWAAIVFYPGFIVGNTAFRWGLSLEACKVVGVLAVGLAYAAVAALTRRVWLALKHRRQSATPRQSPE